MSAPAELYTLPLEHLDFRDTTRRSPVSGSRPAPPRSTRGPSIHTTSAAAEVLGGYRYVKEDPVARMMRDAKITQIHEARAGSSRW